MKAAMRCLVDTNVLVYAAVRESPLHAAARARLAALTSRDDTLFVAPQVLREYVSVVTRSAVLSRPRVPADAVADVRVILSVFKLLHEPADVVERWMDLVGRHAVSGAAVHDAYLVATMLGSGVDHILTNNQNHFQRFEGLTVLPLAESST